MAHRRFQLTVLSGMLASAMLTGCGGSASSGVFSPRVSLANVSAQGRHIISSSEYARLVRNYRSTTVTLAAGGGTFRWPSYNGFRGSGAYSGNDAVSGTTMTVTNSGLNDPLSAPTPPDGSTPVMFAEAAINGSAAVTFQSSNLQMTLVSAALQAGSSYEVDVFAAGAPGIVESYGAGTPKNGKLKFQSPFSGIAIAPGTPVTIELAIVPYPQTLYVSNDYSSSNSSPGVYLFNGDSFGSSAQGFLSLAEAGALAVDDAQNLYVGACIPNTECFANEYSPALQGLVSYYTSFYPQWCGPTGATVASGANPAVGVSCSNVVDTFPQGSGSPQSSYPDSNLSSVDCVAFDAAGNQYVGGVNSRSGSYEVDISGPGGTWSSLGLELVEYPAQLTLDSSGNLLVAEPGLGVAVFTPGQAAPSAYIDYGADTISLALGNGGNWLYVYQGRLNNNDNSVNVYRYPAGTLLGQYFLYEFNGQIAVAPRVPLFNPAAMRRTHPGFRYWTDTIAPRPRAKEH